VNINAGCGSQHLGGLVDRVRTTGADLGLAHDGDADRVIAVDEQGRVVDGDCLIAALAIELKEAGRLDNNLVVSTVMANLGFRRAMAAAGIELVETPVGDRYVLEKMRDTGAAIGGEQSGHVIFSKFSTTGDGLITGLRLAGLMVSSGRKLSELAAVVEKFPQVLVNVPVSDARRAGASKALADAVDAAQKDMGDRGRVLVRPSGTEPLVRVMVEAPDTQTADSVAAGLAALIAAEAL
jgi:phosphoglucosamine mutase